jgi:hypothetical protein
MLRSLSFAIFIVGKYTFSGANIVPTLIILSAVFEQDAAAHSPQVRSLPI